jgi:hypothetical protein
MEPKTLIVSIIILVVVIGISAGYATGSFNKLLGINQPRDCLVGDWVKIDSCKKDIDNKYYDIYKRSLTQPINGGKACPEEGKKEFCSSVDCTITSNWKTDKITYLKTVNSQSSYDSNKNNLEYSKDIFCSTGSTDNVSYLQTREESKNYTDPKYGGKTCKELGLSTSQITSTGFNCPRDCKPFDWPEYGKPNWKACVNESCTSTVNNVDWSENLETRKDICGYDRNKSTNYNNKTVIGTKTVSRSNAIEADYGGRNCTEEEKITTKSESETHANCPRDCQITSDWIDTITYEKCTNGVCTESEYKNMLYDQSIFCPTNNTENVSFKQIINRRKDFIQGANGGRMCSIDEVQDRKENMMNSCPRDCKTGPSTIRYYKKVNNGTELELTDKLNQEYKQADFCLSQDRFNDVSIRKVTTYANTEPAYNGKTCQQLNIPYTVEQVYNCPKDCNVSSWTNSGACIGPCGNDLDGNLAGSQLQVRNIINGGSAYGGATCPNLSQNIPCLAKTCSPLGSIEGSCTGPNDCQSRICQNGVCVNPIGGTCITDNQCISNICLNGTCITESVLDTRIISILKGYNNHNDRNDIIYTILRKSRKDEDNYDVCYQYQDSNGGIWKFFQSVNIENGNVSDNHTNLNSCLLETSCSLNTDLVSLDNIDNKYSTYSKKFKVNSNVWNTEWNNDNGVIENRQVSVIQNPNNCTWSVSGIGEPESGLGRAGFTGSTGPSGCLRGLWKNGICQAATGESCVNTDGSLYKTTDYCANNLCYESLCKNCPNGDINCDDGTGPNTALYNFVNEQLKIKYNSPSISFTIDNKNRAEKDVFDICYTKDGYYKYTERFNKNLTTQNKIQASSFTGINCGYSLTDRNNLIKSFAAQSLGGNDTDVDLVSVSPLTVGTSTVYNTCFTYKKDSLGNPIYRYVRQFDLGGEYNDNTSAKSLSRSSELDSGCFTNNNCYVNAFFVKFQTLDSSGKPTGNPVYRMSYDFNQGNLAAGNRYQFNNFNIVYGQNNNFRYFDRYLGLNYMPPLVSGWPSIPFYNEVYCKIKFPSKGNYTFSYSSTVSTFVKLIIDSQILIDTSVNKLSGIISITDETKYYSFVFSFNYGGFNFSLNMNNAVLLTSMLYVDWILFPFDSLYYNNQTDMTVFTINDTSRNYPDTWNSGQGDLNKNKINVTGYFQNNWIKTNYDALNIGFKRIMNEKFPTTIPIGYTGPTGFSEPNVISIQYIDKNNMKVPLINYDSSADNPIDFDRYCYVITYTCTRNGIPFVDPDFNSSRLESAFYFALMENCTPYLYDIKPVKDCYIKNQTLTSISYQKCVLGQPTCSSYLTSSNLQGFNRPQFCETTTDTTSYFIQNNVLSNNLVEATAGGYTCSKLGLNNNSTTKIDYFSCNSGSNYCPNNLLPPFISGTQTLPIVNNGDNFYKDLRGLWYITGVNTADSRTKVNPTNSSEIDLVMNATGWLLWSRPSTSIFSSLTNEMTIYYSYYITNLGDTTVSYSTQGHTYGPSPTTPSSLPRNTSTQVTGTFKITTSTSPPLYPFYINLNSGAYVRISNPKLCLL